MPCRCPTDVPQILRSEVPEMSEELRHRLSPCTHGDPNCPTPPRAEPPGRFGRSRDFEFSYCRPCSSSCCCPVPPRCPRHAMHRSPPHSTHRPYPTRPEVETAPPRTLRPDTGNARLVCSSTAIRSTYEP